MNESVLTLGETKIADCWVEAGTVEHLWVFQHEVLWKNLAHVGQGIMLDLPEKATEHPPHLLLEGTTVVWVLEFPGLRVRIASLIF